MQTQEKTDRAGSDLQIRRCGAFDADAPARGLAQLESASKKTVYQASEDGDKFSHHPYIAHHRGVLYAMWSSHACDEDASGQRVCCSVSKDNGESWSPADELFPPHDRVRTRAGQTNNRDRILIANGFAAVNGALYAVAEAHTISGLRRQTPPPGMEVPEKLIGTGFARPGLGRLARRIDPASGPGRIFWLTAQAPAPVPGFPSYPDARDPSFRETAAAVRAWQARPENLPCWDMTGDSAKVWAPDGHRLCEPTPSWHVRGSILARLWRDGPGIAGVKYAQFSLDRGESWLPPEKSEFPDSHSRAAAGNLPGGAAYVIGNPGRTRDPLVLSLADDGLNFDRHFLLASNAPDCRYEGVHKAPGFHYPHACIADRRLVVVYTVGKEDVEVSVFASTGRCEAAPGFNQGS